MISLAEQVALAAADVDRVVIGVHRSIDAELRSRIMDAANSVGLESVAYWADLSDFMVQGRLTDEIVSSRFRYSAKPAAAAIGTLRTKGLILDAGRPVDQLIGIIDEVNAARVTTAKRLWAQSNHLEALASGAVVILGRATGPLIEPYRALHEPDDAVGVLWHRLIGMRYLRADAHAAAWHSAGLTAGAIKDLTAAWHGDAVDTPGLALVESGALTPSGAITDHGTTLRDSIEAETNERSAPCYGALGTEGLAGWMAALAELPPRS